MFDTAMTSDQALDRQLYLEPASELKCSHYRYGVTWIAADQYHHRYHRNRTPRERQDWNEYREAVRKGVPTPRASTAQGQQRREKHRAPFLR